MRKLKLFFACLLMAVLSIGQMWADSEIYTFTSKAWAATNSASQAANWTSGKDGNQLTSGRGVQITTGASGANGTSPISFSNVSKVVVTYSTNASNGAGSIAVKVGSNTAKSQNVTKTGGTSDRTLEYNYTTAETGSIKLTVTCTTNSIYVKSVAVTYSPGGGGDNPVPTDKLAWGATSAKVFVNGETYDGHVAHNALPSLTYTLSAALSYSSTNTSVAKITNAGVVSIEGEGTTKIRATYPADATYSETTVEYDLTVDMLRDISDAIDKIDGSTTGFTNQYVAGIISQVDEYNSKYSSITYWISDDGKTTSSQLKVYSGKGLNGANFSAKEDLQVGDQVVIKGKLKYYNPDNEFDANSQILSLVRKSLDHITVATSPTKLTYKEGQSFDPTGLVITKHYDNNDTENVTYAGNESDFTFDPALNTELATSNTAVSITYGGKSVDQTITVNPKDKYTVTITAPMNGTVKVQNAGVDIESGVTEIVEGTTLTIVANPNQYYGVDKIYVNGAEQVAYTFVLTQNTTVEVTFKEDETPAAVLYLVDANSEGTFPGSYKVGNKVTLPDGAAACAGKTFVGWSEEAITTPVDALPTTKFHTPGETNFTLAAEEQTLYAVYKTEVPGTPVTKSDELTYTLIGITGTSYTAWSGKTSVSTAVYAGQSAGGNASIQIRSNNNNSGIITTTSGGKLKKVTITWNSNTSSGRNVTVCAKNSAYSSAADLFGTNKGTELGTIVAGTSTELVVTGNYTHVGIRASDPIYMDKVTIEWEIAGESTYTYSTTCTPKLDAPTFTPLSGGEFDEPTNITISGPAGATIYYVVNETELTEQNRIEYTGAINLNTNGMHTIQAIAVKEGCDDSDVATATYTVEIPLTFEQFMADKPTTNTKIDLTGAIIWAQKATSGLIFIQKGDKAIALYKPNGNEVWNYGKKISGIIEGKYSLYHAMPQLSVSDFMEAAVVDALASDYPEALVVTDANAEASMVVDNAFRLIKMENMKVGKDQYNYVTITSTGDNSYYYEDELTVLTQTLPNPNTLCTVSGILYPWYESNTSFGYDQLAPLSVNDISTGNPKADAILPIVSEESGNVAKDKIVIVTPQEGMTTTLKIGDAEAQTITEATNVTIDESKSIVVNASAYYYTNNSKTYTYTVDPSLTEHTITIDANIENGSVSASEASAAQNVTITLTPNPIAHYHLSAWDVYETDSDPKVSVEVTNNQFSMPAVAVTVSATFVENDFATIVFDDNGATSGSMSNDKVYVGESLTLPSCDFVKNGNAFTGWKIGGVDYAVGASYNVTSKDQVTIVAQWNPYPWGVDGKWELVTDASTLHVDDYVIIASNSMEKALGAQNSNYRTAEAIVRNTEKTLISSIGDATVLQLVAGSKANTFALKDYVANNYLAASSSTSNENATSATVTDEASWSISFDEDRIATVVAQGDFSRNHLRSNTGNTGRFTCYASNTTVAKLMLYKFTAGTYYSITYAKGTEAEVTNMPETQVTENDGTATLSDKTPVYVGYMFNGWKQGETTYQPNDPIGPLSENITLTAQWTIATEHNVTYIYAGNVVSGEVPAETGYYPGATVTVTDAVLAQDGYLFAGWEYDGMVYTAGSTFAMPNEDVTLTAKFVQGAIYTFPATAQGTTTAVGAPEDASFELANGGGYNSNQIQLVKDKSMTLTLSGYDLYTIKAITLNMRSNASSGAGTFSATINGETVASIASATTFNQWFDNTSYGTTNRDVHVTMNPTRVMPGQDIVITLNGTTNSIYIKSVAIEYERVLDDVRTAGVASGVWGTICPKKEVKYPTGASFYEISYVEYHSGVPYKVFYDEIAEDASLEAGHPYLFQADEESTAIKGIAIGEDATIAINDHGFKGVLADELITVEADDVTAYRYYIVYDNEIRLCGEGQFRIKAERAYLDLSDPNVEKQYKAPIAGRRRVSLTNGAPQTTTGIDALNSAEAPVKMVIDGQLYILRGEKMYDATGHLVK